MRMMPALQLFYSPALPMSDSSSPGPRDNPGLDRLSIGASLGFVVVFLVATALAGPKIADFIAAGFTWTAVNLGSVFEWLLIATFVIALGVAAGPAGSARIGGIERPELGTFQWLSIILCTLLAGGGVFFAAGEPIYHFVVTPPAFDSQPGTADAVPDALAQAFFHRPILHVWQKNIEHVLSLKTDQVVLELLHVVNRRGRQFA